MKRVVITGMGCVTPVGNDVSSFWQSLINAKHGFGPITRFDTTEMKVNIAAEVKDFNPEIYIAKSEIKKTDLYAQYAMAAATQAVEESGIIGNIEPERLGVYIGSGIGGISTFSAQSDMLSTRGPSRVSPFFIPMMIANIASGLVAIKYNAQGPNLPVVSACATGTHAIGEAFHAIRHGYADAIITGGAEAAIVPISVAGFSNCLALSTTNDPENCSMPFDKRRDGFVIGEGAGILVLEEYERAKARGAKIYCAISGYAHSNDAYHVTAPRPDGSCAARMIGAAIREAGITPDEHMYINAHGTSTPPNDKLETLAIKTALGDIAYKVPVSSTKSMTGHMLGAAGGVEAIVAAKTIETGIIPPTANYKEPDPECDLDYVPNVARNCDVDKAMSISIGFGGHNAAIVLKRLDI